MKKIFFALVAISLVFVSCKKNNNDAGTTPEGPTPEGPTPEEPTPEALFIKMTVSGTPTATTADILCEPSNDSLYYFVVYGDASFGDLTAADFYEFANERIALYIANNYTIDDCASLGEQVLDFTGLTPETTYTVYAGQVDEDGTEFEDIFTCNFTTAAMPQSSMTVNIEFVDSINTVVFTPSASDTYGMYIETREDFDAYWETFDATTWAQELSDWAYSYAYYGLEFPTYTGEIVVDLTQFLSETVPAGTNLVALAAPMQSGIVNGTANGIEFTPTTDIVVAQKNTAAKVGRTQKSPLRMARR